MQLTLKEADELELFRSTTFIGRVSPALDKSRNSIHSMKHQIIVTKDRVETVSKKAEKWTMRIKWFEKEHGIL